ncbi:MAG TPA: tetratricopeptide repeat protein [Gaiellaceae bacterium]|nr:tetratricopeptide repeat protein [Gaiellaceae bacterium]
MTEQLERRLVAVMFTDMVGYTALLYADEQAALAKRALYWDVLEARHADHGGTIVQRLGDGSMSMFPSAFAAAQAATAIQEELAAHDVSVRIGIHVGEVIVEPERLTGDAVNIAARIESFAVPGGVLLSDSAFDQIKNQSSIETVPLGQFRFKNVGRPFELYAVTADGLVVPAPDALRGKGERLTGLPSNLPTAATPLVGRGTDLASLADLVRSHRVLTITGPGGVGKTRVLAELGRLLAPEFPDGLAFATFADVIDPAGLLPALAEALDVKEAEGRTLAEGIDALLGNRKALLLLDNLEQIVDAAATEVARLLASSPELRIAATSRTPLRIAGEREHQLAPLEIGSAVTLFVERAPSLELTAENEAAVTEICRRLDGLPLALELAAARLRLLTPDALLERLDHALDVLTSGSRDTPTRQQTLRATIEWSHSLLDEGEHRLFRRLAVFAGGCTVEDTEAVCDAGLDELESLVEKALLTADERLLMLETIREYAREQLEAAGEADEIAVRHAARYAEVAREIRDGIEGSTQVASVERGIAEDANLTAALDTLLLRARGGDVAACELGLQLSGDLWMYWHFRGKNVTAGETAGAFLAADRAGARTVGRAGALLTAGLASMMTGDSERADRDFREAYELASERDGGRERCMAAMCLGFASIGVDVEAGVEWASRCVEESRVLQLEWPLALGLSVEGILKSIAGDSSAAGACFVEALEIQARLGDREGAGLSLGGLAALAAGRGHTEEALDLYRQALFSFESIGDRAEEARILSEMAATYLASGDAEFARRYFFESVQAHTDVASVRGVALSLVGLAAVEAVEQRPERAVQIAAAADAHAHEEGIVNVYSEETPGSELVERARASLSADELARATELGGRLSIDEALEFARAARTATV